MKNATTKFDFRRTLTCAALATITSLGMFTVVTNVMTPMFAGIRLLASTGSTQEKRIDNAETKVCAQTAYADEREDSRKASII